MIKIDGRAIAQKIIEKLKKLSKPEKILAAVFVGENSSSAAFLKIKKRIASELGIEFKLIDLEESVSQEELEKIITRLSNDDRVGGIIIQLPLPEKFNRDQVLSKIDPKKDVDALTDGAVVESPVVGVIKEIIKYLGFKIEDFKMIAVVGKGILVGQPIIRWLELGIRNKELGISLKVADSQTENLKEFLADTDLIITGVGKAGLVKPEWLKSSAGVIDFGFPPDFQMSDVRCQNYKIRNPKSEIRNLGFYTPTPGGTGPILVAKLFENFYKLC